MRIVSFGIILCSLALTACGGSSGSGSSSSTQTAATPTLSPAAGTYTSAQSVTISDATSGASIYYTTDGTTPSTASALYSGAIPVSATKIIQAIAVASGYNNSNTASATYTITLPAAATPTFSPAGGSYTTAQSVTLSDATSSATIYYTTDGTTPTTSSSVYSSPIVVSSTTTLKAIAAASGYSNSATATATYTFPTTATPTFSLTAGTYYGTQTLTLSDATSGATIYYTTDGSTPTTASSVYSTALTVSATETVRALAAASGYLNSAIVSATYTISNATTVTPVLTTYDCKGLVSTCTSLMKAQTAIPFTATLPSATDNIITVDENTVYQSIDGFGASTTDSSAYLLMGLVPSGSQDSVLSDLFTRDNNGIGLSFLRNPMGASDIARSVYSFDDLASGSTDNSLSTFSIHHDETYDIPLLVKAKALNPDLKIMANPWSPPAWMKASGTMFGGSLTMTAANETAFANYFVKYIQAAKADGVNIDYLSLQNEPLYNATSYPGMYMVASDELAVLRDYLLPALSTAGITTKVLIWDHNWDNSSYPETILADSTVYASSQVAGTAWHGYGGTPGAQTTVYNQYPNKGVWQTEHSGGTWVTDQYISDFLEIPHVLRNYGKAYVKWSLALDQNLGPNLTTAGVGGGCATCTPIVMINSYTGAASKTIEYYTMGHFSKYVLPGAQRIYSSNGNGLVSVAFLNPDDSKALFVFNDTASSSTFSVQWGTQAFSYTMAAYSAVTFTWAGTQAGTPTIPAASQIQASSYTTEKGMASEESSDSTGGYDMGYLTTGAVSVYKNVDFASTLTSVKVRSASDNATGSTATLSFYQDSTSGTPIATITLPATGGWQSWSTTSATLSGLTSGVHDLYVVVTSSGSNLNWFQFQ